MASCDNSACTISKLPDEILLEILRIDDTTDETSRYTQIANLRLVCRRFCSLTSPLLCRRRTTVDISRPVTLRRLQSITNNPVLAGDVAEVCVRLHFRHPWIAASIENFHVSIKSEWLQRLQSWPDRNFSQRDKRDFNAIVHFFLEDLESLYSKECSTSNDSESIDSHDGLPWSQRVLKRAYHAYKSGFDAQNALLADGNFAREFAETLSKLPNVTQLIFHDGELHNNHDPGTKIKDIDAEDKLAQEEALVDVLSRPMLWEELRWIKPLMQVPPAVPINLLIDIPLNISHVGSVVLDQLIINVSVAPNWMSLVEPPGKLADLSKAIKEIDVFQFSFRPRCRSGCGPWERDENGVPEFIMPPVEELQAINQYLSSMLNAGCISHFEVNLSEFWYSIGSGSLLPVHDSLGADLSWPVGSNLESVTLANANLTSSELERIAKSLAPNCQIDLCEVYLRRGLWGMS